MISTGVKRPTKEKQKKVLLGLIEHHIKTGRPVGSHTLQEAGFDYVSSATLRNYFSELEDEGFLTQPHASGGRVPTPKAWRFYAEECLGTPLPPLSGQAITTFANLGSNETKEIKKELIVIGETLSQALRLPVLFSYPRFDQEYLSSLKFVSIDSFTYLLVLITDFGTIKTEILHLPKKLSTFTQKRIEQYFQWRLLKSGEAPPLDPEEKEIATEIYQETVLRYAIRHSFVSDEEIHRTGLSRILNYREQFEPEELASLFEFLETKSAIRNLFRTVVKKNEKTVFIESDLFPFIGKNIKTTILAEPYFVQRQPIGAFGLVAPFRIPYSEALLMLHAASQAATELLTKSVFRYKLSWRVPEEPPQPNPGLLSFDNQGWILEDQSQERSVQ